jgi:hypothetical protein
MGRPIITDPKGHVKLVEFKQKNMTLLRFSVEADLVTTKNKGKGRRTK